MKLKALATAAALVAGTSLSAMEERTVVGVAVGNDNFETLVAAVTAAGLEAHPTPPNVAGTAGELFVEIGEVVALDGGVEGARPGRREDIEAAGAQADLTVGHHHGAGEATDADDAFVSVVSAAYSGDQLASGIYTGGEAISPLSDALMMPWSSSRMPSVPSTSTSEAMPLSGISLGL